MYWTECPLSHNLGWTRLPPQAKKIASFCGKVSPLGALTGRCPPLSSGHCYATKFNVCSCALLGFNVLVVPLNEVGAPPQKNQILVYPCQGMFQNCWENTCYLQGGPFFAQCCQSFLQGQKISDEATPAYLASLKSLNRYDFAFKKIRASAYVKIQVCQQNLLPNCIL